MYHTMQLLEIPLSCIRTTYLKFVTPLEMYPTKLINILVMTIHDYRIRVSRNPFFSAECFLIGSLSVGINSESSLQSSGPGARLRFPPWGCLARTLGWAHGGPEVLKTTRKTVVTTERIKKSQTIPDPQIDQQLPNHGGQGRQPHALRCLPAATARCGRGCNTSVRPRETAPGTDMPHSPGQPLTCGSRCRRSQRRSRADRAAMPGRPRRRRFVPTWAGPDLSAPATQGLPRTSRPTSPDVPPHLPEPPTGSAGVRRHFWRCRMKWRVAAVAAAAWGRWRWGVVWALWSLWRRAVMVPVLCPRPCPSTGSRRSIPGLCLRGWFALTGPPVLCPRIKRRRRRRASWTSPSTSTRPSGWSSRAGGKVSPARGCSTKLFCLSAFSLSRCLLALPRSRCFPMKRRRRVVGGFTF